MAAKKVVPTNEVLHVLREARELLARKNGWCQRRYARRMSTGTAVEIRREDNPDKVAFCMLGAVLWVGNPGSDVAVAAEHVLEAALPKRYRSPCIASYNDAKKRTQEQVLAVYDKAIASLEKG